MALVHLSCGPTHVLQLFLNPAISGRLDAIRARESCEAELGRQMSSQSKEFRKRGAERRSHGQMSFLSGYGAIEVEVY